MKYEIDFFAVGDASKGGDAITFRFWDEGVDQFVGVIDGGAKSTGDALVKHIKDVYGSEVVNVVINTHPHQDHTAGLSTVLNDLEVHLLLMHLPWEHSNEILNLFHDGRITSSSLSDRIKKGLQATHDLYELSLKKEIPVAEPFPGCDTGHEAIQILGPSKTYYQELVPNFTSTPQAASLSEALAQFVQKSFVVLKEALDKETLVDPVAGTNAENNSSAITLLTLGGNLFLFTGDAGVPALDRACDHLERNGTALRNFRLVQIPHHGSKRNVGPTLLNRMIGEIGSSGGCGTAIASVPKQGEPKHPSKRVLNAFTRRGAKTLITQGKSLCSYDGSTPRAGWTTAVALPLFDEVEDEES